MEEEAKADSTEYQHYNPEHPLPKAIQDMNRDDTVCKYCGVSYLIHNEIKALEAKLKRTEEELEHYRGSVQREKLLREDVERLDGEQALMKTVLNEKASLLSSVTSQLKKTADDLAKTKDENDDILNKFTHATALADLLRSKHSLLLSGLPSVSSDISSQKAALRDIHAMLAEQETQMKSQFSIIISTVSRVCSRHSQASQLLSDTVATLKIEISQLTSQLTEMKSRCTQTTGEVDRLTSENGQMEKLCHSLKLELKSAQEDLENVQSKNKMSSSIAEQYKEQLKSKTQELENISSQNRRTIESLEFGINRLQDDMRAKDVEMDTYRRELKNIKDQYEEQRRQEQEIHRKASVSSTEKQDLKEILVKTQKENSALKSERELMITSHQIQISELRESFKQKLGEADRWPEKLETALCSERDKHSADMKKLECELKESFAIEIQIEKQRCQVLINKSLMEIKDREKQMKSHQSTAESNLRSEIAELQKRLADSRALAKETEQRLKDEVESLKRVISDLEARLAQLGSVSNEEYVAIRQKQQETESVLHDTQKKAEEVLAQLDTAKQEIQFLQDTVGRECEERFELTESLSEAREQLLAYKRLPGGDMPGSAASITPRRNATFMMNPSNDIIPNTGPNNISTVPRRNSNSSPESMTSQSLKTSQNYDNTNGVGTPPPRTIRSSTSDHANDTANVNLGYRGQIARSGGKLKGGSLAESRRRIATILGRKT